MSKESKIALVQELFKPYYLLIIVFLYVLFEAFLKLRYRLYYAQKLPTAYGLPLIGIAHKLMPIKKFLYSIDGYFEKFKSATFCAWLGRDPYIITIDPQIIKMITNSEDFLNKATTLYTPINNALHNGIITSAASKWKNNRKLMNSSFSHTVLTSFIPIFNRGAENALDRFGSLLGMGEQHVFDILKRVVLEIAVETTMGIVMQEGNDLDEQLLEDFNYLIDKVAQDAMYSSIGLGFLARPPKYYRRRKALKEHIEELIKQEYAAREENNNNPSSELNIKNKDKFLTRAIRFHNQGLLQLEDVVIESLTMIVGSFETVSTTIYSTLTMLAMHPTIQAKLFEEIIDILPSKNESIEYDHLRHIPYMDMVIDETLRLMPSIPVIGRQAMKETKLTEHISMSKNMQVIIPIFNLHRAKSIWGPNANSFNPENFLPEESSKRHAYAYMPFSKGARNCIGWRYAQIALRVILLRLVRNFKFSTNFKYEDLVFMDLVSLRYEVEPLLSIESRD